MLCVVPRGRFPYFWFGFLAPESGKREDIRWNEDRDHYDFGDIDFTELFEVIKGNGPCNEERMAHRVAAHEDGAWAREAASAYAAKRATRTPGAA